MANNDKTSLILSLSERTKKKQKSISDINPSATNAELINFAQNLISLSTDTLEEANRIDKRTLSNDDSYTIYGASEISTQYLPEVEPQISKNYYSVINERTNKVVQTNSFTYAMSDYDTTKAYVAVITDPWTGEPTSNYAEINVSYKDGVNEYTEVKVTLSAAGDFGSVSKVCTVKILTYEEE